MKESKVDVGWSLVNDGTTNTDGSKKHSPLYTTILNVYHKRIANDPDSEWKTLEDFVAYCMIIWKRQKMRCNISRGRMDVERGPTQPSLDAKDAALKHVRDNLQFVCVFLQYGQEHHGANTDGKTFKTHKDYCKYLGVPTRR